MHSCISPSSVGPKRETRCLNLQGFCWHHSAGEAEEGSEGQNSETGDTKSGPTGSLSSPRHTHFPASEWHEGKSVQPSRGQPSSSHFQVVFLHSAVEEPAFGVFSCQGSVVGDASVLWWQRLVQAPSVGHPHPSPCFSLLQRCSGVGVGRTP